MVGVWLRPGNTRMCVVRSCTFVVGVGVFFTFYLFKNKKYTSAWFFHLFKNKKYTSACFFCWVGQTVNFRTPPWPPKMIHVARRSRFDPPDWTLPYTETSTITPKKGLWPALKDLFPIIHPCWLSVVFTLRLLSYIFADHLFFVCPSLGPVHGWQTEASQVGPYGQLQQQQQLHLHQQQQEQQQFATNGVIPEAVETRGGGDAAWAGLCRQTPYAPTALWCQERQETREQHGENCTCFTEGFVYISATRSIHNSV